MGVERKQGGQAKGAGGKGEGKGSGLGDEWRERGTEFIFLITK